MPYELPFMEVNSDVFVQKRTQGNEVSEPIALLFGPRFYHGVHINGFLCVW